jgi:hypothetical protein
MDDEIEILDELEVIKVIKNPIYKPKRVHKEPKSKPISQLQKCRFCELSFDNKKMLYKHCAIQHYRNYLEKEVKRYFKVYWKCWVCFDELNGYLPALLHVAISHCKGTVLVIRKNFQKAKY